MTSGWIIFLEISLVLGAALAFGLREIFSLRRDARERAARAEAGEAAAPPPTRSGEAS